jgi:transcriptional regulator with XRE-family HTH domain
MGGREVRDILGKNLKTFRNRRSWSQADLAEHAEISINFLGDIERGKKWPHPETLSNLARALDISVFQLFIEEGQTLNPDAKVLMNQFIEDVSLSIGKSLSLSVNQSIKNILKQYKLR